MGRVVLVHISANPVQPVASALIARGTQPGTPARASAVVHAELVRSSRR